MENHADHLVNDYDHKKDYKWISQAIESLDPAVDYAEIWRLSTNYYIDDFVMNLIYTLGIPAFTQPPEGSIVMGVSTKKAVKQPQKRADDTLQHFWFWFEFGPDHPNMKASLAHVNLVHESLSKKNPNTFVKRDVIYTCCWIACMFHRLKLSLGLNGYSEKQKIATNIYWKKIVAMFWSEDGLLTVIPPRKNAKPWKDTKISSLERNELLRTVKHLGKTIWKNWSGYHRRSLVETKMHCIKLLGDKLTARSFPSQVNEIHARMAVLNKFTELGRPHTQVVS